MNKNNVFSERKALIQNDVDPLRVQPWYKGIRRIELLRTWLSNGIWVKKLRRTKLLL